MKGDESPDSRGALFGVFIVAVGVVTLLSVGSIHEMSFGSNTDPGPRALPMVLAGCLILGGLAEIVVKWTKRRRVTAVEARPETATVPADGPNLWDAGILLAALIIYIAALPWVGFTLSTLAFTLSMMWRLQVRWVLNVVVSLCLVGAVHVLFVMVFRVQLPPGVLGLPF